MKVVVGLGNPGLRYRKTRHNIGFMALNTLAKKHRLAIKKKGFGGVYGIGRISREEVILFEPLTYMNSSGEALKAVCSSHLADRDDLLVVSDDLDLPFGVLRLKEKGSSGGHNGLQSIIDKMGTDFARLKVGIGTENRLEDAAAYVLASFSRQERASLPEILDATVERIETWIVSGK